MVWTSSSEVLPIMNDEVGVPAAEAAITVSVDRTLGIRRVLLAVGVGGVVALLAWLALWLAVNL
ncbi:hypothetical protein B0293_29000 [Amycolatopsis azurea DSM 43854]|uniref:Uncharacterized protein n=2 Tax=Amycolatopsis azurea DSM 43854 TaxID=1238180 RepID=A0ABX3J5Q8_9PSEU|nr:hypothetical protein B0293_29000 [Amycolatopsis azurea DSM 43854]